MLEALDTNVPIYAYVDFSDPRKMQIARELIRRLEDTGNAIISTQVLNEFSNIALKLNREKDRQPIVEEYLRNLASTMTVVPVSAEIILAAIDRHYTNNLSFYDALVVESALSAGATILYTEDLQHGQSFGVLRIVNPFL